jgi:L-rhamnose mutarotase
MQRIATHMADFFDVGPGMQDGSTVYPVEIFYAPGDETLQVPLQRTGGLHLVKAGHEELVRQVCQAAPSLVYAAIRRAGIRNDCIYLVGPMLFTYFQARDTSVAHASLAADPAYQAWHAQLAGAIDIHSSFELDEVFYVA